MKKKYILYLFCFCGWMFREAAAGNTGTAGRPPAFRVYDARCQALRDPAGIGESQPSFSWKLASSHRNVRQTAYRVTVASSPDKLTRDPDLWDSGRILSGRNTFAGYDGMPLQSVRRYYWKVEVWVNGGTEAAESPVSSFVTGILGDQGWRGAQWIAYETLPDSLKVFPGVHGSGNSLGNKAVKRAVVPRFRREIRVGKPVEQAFILACGLGQYALYLNGRRVDSGFLNPSWSDYTKRCYYNTYDVTSLLQNGANAIGAIAGTGFLYINRERYRKLVIAAGYPMLRLKMFIRYKDGTEETLVSDDAWKTAPSAVTYTSIYGGEDFDARKVQRGWSEPGFDDAGWKPVEIIPGPGGRMQAQEAYPVRTDQVFPAVKTGAGSDSLYLYDFGQNMSGIVRLQLSGRKGYRLRVTPAELLDGEGLPDQGATGSPYYWEYTLDGSGPESWQPLFTYYGFRYASLSAFDPSGRPVKIREAVNRISLTALHTQNGAPQVGSFECSDTLFNRIFSLIRWGIRNNMSNVATDCPHREKLGWLEETHLLGNSIQYNYDIQRFYNKIIEDMIDAQLPDGLVPDIAPEYVEFVDGFRDSPEWGSAGVLLPWYVYRWYGDRQALKKSYAMMKKYVAYLGSRADGYLLAYGLGDWFDLGPKPPGVSQLTPLGLTATAFYYYDALILSRTAAVLEDGDAAARYASLADTIRQAFNKKYFDPATKVYATGSQTSYAIPLYFGIAPDSCREEVLKRLVQSVTSNNNALTAGDIGFRYVVQALENAGAYQLLYAMNNRTDVPGYGYQLKKGATALTESWQALRNVSNDHMMLGHLMEWLYGGLGGIRQQEGSAGYRKILIAPQWVKGIDWVNTTYRSVNGLIVVRWRRGAAGNVLLQVEIPANTTAKIKLPSVHPDRIKEQGKPLNEIRDGGILKIEAGETASMVEVGSGKYDFSFKLPENK